MEDRSKTLGPRSSQQTMVLVYICGLRSPRNSRVFIRQLQAWDALLPISSDGTFVSSLHHSAFFLPCFLALNPKTLNLCNCSTCFDTKTIQTAVGNATRELNRGANKSDWQNPLSLRKRLVPFGSLCSLPKTLSHIWPR